MTERDEDVVRKVLDAKSPRTPLHFKELVHIVAPDTEAPEHRFAVSEHHRSLGYACGVSAPCPKPISKMLKHDR